MASGPLHGIKVFEVSQMIAGPFCGVMLADFGADVVKVESPKGEATRLSGQVIPGESKGFHAHNRGKRSLVLDLASSDGREVAHRLIRDFDVFLFNSRPGSAAKLGLDYETLRAINPSLIYMENTAFGEFGPDAMLPGSDIIAQAYTGLMAAEGHLDEHGAPVRINSIPPTDFVAGIAAAAGICAALLHREHTGQGQKVSTSLLQAGLALQYTTASRMPVFDAISTDPMLARLKQAQVDRASYAEQLEILGDPLGRMTGAFKLYYGGYGVQDGALVLGALTRANQDQIRGVLGLLDSDPTRDPDFNAADPANDFVVAEVQARIREILLTKTMDEWLALFRAAGAPVTKVNFAQLMADDPQVQAMGCMLDLDHERTGPEQMVGPLVSLSETPTGSKRSAPPLGRDTDEVLGEHGLSVAEIETLRGRGVLG